MYRLDMGPQAYYFHIIMKQRQNLHLFTIYWAPAVYGQKGKETNCLSRTVLTLSAMPESLLKVHSAGLVSVHSSVGSSCTVFSSVLSNIAHSAADHEIFQRLSEGWEGSPLLLSLYDKAAAS